MAFDKSDSLRIQLYVDELLVQSTVIGVAASGDDIRATVPIPFRGLAELRAQLMVGQAPLFEGSAPVTIVGDTTEVTLTLDPVVFGIDISQDPIVVPRTGIDVQLEAHALFATGDTIPGIDLTWSSASPGLIVSPDGVLTALATGEARVVARHQEHSDASTVFVEPITYVGPDAFADATAWLGMPVVVDFEDIDPGPVTNVTAGRDPLDGDIYADRGISFSTPGNLPLFVAPGGLPWNASNSLSVNTFPNDNVPGDDTDDSLNLILDPAVLALSFVIVEHAHADGESVRFVDAAGETVAEIGFSDDFAPNRALIGILSSSRPIASVLIVEAANDGDDVTYDDFTFVGGRN